MMDSQAAIPEQRYFAVAARGLEQATANELADFGAGQIEATPGGVWFRGQRRTLYRALLESRTATRILRPLREFAAQHAEMLYSQTRRVRWEDFLDPTRTFAVNVTMAGRGVHARLRGEQPAESSPRRGRPAESVGLTHSHFAALKIKDAIVDRLRREQGARPNVDLEHPDVRIHAHFAGGRCILSVDAAGASLHERGYRRQATAAPLKETLAAGLLALAGWDGRVPLVDPMCGSGTIAIEGALVAQRIAPGLLRESYACERWPDFDPRLWRELRDEAAARRLPQPPAPIFASDADPRAVAAARENARAAGVDRAIQFAVARAEELSPPTTDPGTIIVNPPYGERMGTGDDLTALYKQLGDSWKQRFPGWTAFFLAGNPPLAKSIGLWPAKEWRLFNGPLECRFLKYELFGGRRSARSAKQATKSGESSDGASEIAQPTRPTSHPDRIG